jgi:RNA polymerase sigma-70 factor (ECF subfamily)
LLEKEKQELLKKALGNVPLKYRAALVLRDIEGLDYATIAQVLHCRLGTVESRIYRGRQILKQELFRWRGETL